MLDCFFFLSAFSLQLACISYLQGVLEINASEPDLGPLYNRGNKTWTFTIFVNS